MVRGNWWLVRALTLGWALAGVAVGCGGDADNFLDGSLSDGFSMEFDRVRVRQYSSELSVEYVVDSDAGERIACRVTVALRGETLVVGTGYDLATRGSVTRGAGFESALPPLATGTLTLTEYAASTGTPVAGSFEASFSMPDASTKVLRGGFAADLDVVQ